MSSQAASDFPARGKEVLDRRDRGDRRQQPTPMLSRYTFFGGKRKGDRRSRRHDGFVDVYGQWLFFVAAAVVLLNALDAFFTMLFLGVGGQELNPVAQFLMDMGTPAFVLSKTIGIGVCMAFLVLVKNFKGARLGLGVVFGIYALLLCWHLFIYFRAPVFWQY